MTSGGAEPPDVDTLVRNLEDLVVRMGAAAKGSGEAREPPAGNGSPELSAVASVMTQVAIAYVATGLRYWGGLATIWARVLPLLAPPMGELGASRGESHSSFGPVWDELRACLVELGKLPTEEARRLQAELERIVPVAGTAAPPRRDQDGQEVYWRRWEIKP